MTAHLRTALLAVLTLCALAITVATVRYLRWRPANHALVVDTWRGVVCTPDTCYAVRHEPVPATP